MNDSNAQPNYYEMQRAWEAQQLTDRQQAPTCGACGERIVWIKSAKSGKPIPCDKPLSYGDGRKTLVTFGGQMIAKAGEHVLGREPHFGTCAARLKERERERAEQDAEQAGCRVYRMSNDE